MIVAYDCSRSSCLDKNSYPPAKKENELLSGQCFVTQLDEVFLSILSLNFNKWFRKIMSN